MGRPAGSKNRTKGLAEQAKDRDRALYPNIKTAVNLPAQALSIPPRYDIIMGLRVIRQGNFRGLWELVELNNDMTRRMVITDANNKGSVITLMTKRVLRASVSL